MWYIHGLCPCSPIQAQYWAVLSELSWGHPHDGVQNLFVHGLCSDSGPSDHALAGRSVVSADLEMPIAAGRMLQTSNGREVWALTMAIQWLIDHSRDGHIYTDS